MLPFGEKCHEFHELMRIRMILGLCIDGKILAQNGYSAAYNQKN
jgi:hypothetical protein